MKKALGGEEGFAVIGPDGREEEWESRSKRNCLEVDYG